MIHANPGLLVKQDGRMLAIYARHGTDQFFNYRYSFTADPGTPEDWSAEQRIPATGGGGYLCQPLSTLRRGWADLQLHAQPELQPDGHHLG